MVSVENYSGYGITSCGKVWSYKTNKFISQRYDKYGYLRVTIMNDDKKMKTLLVHKLVALAYIPNPDGKETVNHKDENKENNCVSNLEWMTRRENLNYGTRGERQSEKISKPVRCIETGIIYKNARVASKEIGIDATNIYNCVNGKRKTAGGFHWERAK